MKPTLRPGTFIFLLEYNLNYPLRFGREISIFFSIYTGKIPND